MKRIWLALILGAISTVGCGVGVSYYAPAPPPPVRVEAFGTAPGLGYVWTPGYWGWNNGAYAWVPGVWVRPPHPRAVWVNGYWEHRGGRYAFHKGHWR